MKEKLFMKVCPRIIIELFKNNQKQNMHNLTKKTGVTYSALVIEIKRLEKASVLETERVGRQRLVNLTQKGEYIGNRIIEIYKLMGWEY